MNMIKKYVYAIIALAVLGTLATALPALADSTSPAGGVWGIGKNHRGGAMMMPGVFGTVSAVNGNILTVSGKQGFGSSVVATTFTVDATNAKVMKNNTAGTVSSILTGDTVAVRGTVNGTNVTATMIRDGVFGGRGMMDKSGQIPTNITGNGQPVVAGIVSAINGTTLSITNKSNVSYTVDATNAKITQGPNTLTISNIAVGDMLIVQGTVNGNSVNASTIIDQTRPASTATALQGTTAEEPHGGFFSGVGSFFARIFGF